MLRILGRANSFNVRKVLWTCDEIGLPFEREDYGRGFRPTDTPEFLKLNPVGQVPCVIDDGLVMRESHAIIRYLAANGPYLLGKDFTLADIPMGLVVNRWFALAELKRPENSAVSRYYELLTERPAFRAHGRNGLP